LGKNTNKASLNELIKLNKAEAKFNATYLARVNKELKKKGVSPKRKAMLAKKSA